jgi:hypothetical protein
MRRIYVASSWRNSHYPAVVQALRDAGHDTYDFRNPEPGDTGFQWSAIDPNWETASVERYLEILAHPLAEAGFQKDASAMKQSDTCVLVLPCGRSAHLEAGWFCGQGRDCFILYPEGVNVEPELMSKMATAVVSGMPALLAALVENSDEVAC